MKLNNGFTLIEVLLALVITVILVTIVAQGFTEGGRASVTAERRTKAVWLAQQKWVELESGELTPTRSVEGTFGSDHPGFRYQIESETGTPAGLYEVSVHVIWSDRGREEAYTLTRLIYQQQPQ